MNNNGGMNTHTTQNATHNITFIGGGNMASALISGLLSKGMSAAQIDVVEPFYESIYSI